MHTVGPLLVLSVVFEAKIWYAQLIRSTVRPILSTPLSSAVPRIIEVGLYLIILHYGGESF